MLIEYIAYVYKVQPQMHSNFFQSRPMITLLTLSSVKNIWQQLLLAKYPVYELDSTKRHIPLKISVAYGSSSELCCRFVN